MIACFAIFSCISASLSLSASAEISLSFSFCSLNSWIYGWIINHIIMENILAQSTHIHFCLKMEIFPFNLASLNCPHISNKNAWSLKMHLFKNTLQRGDFWKHLLLYSALRLEWWMKMEVFGNNYVSVLDTSKSEHTTIKGGTVFNHYCFLCEREKWFKNSTCGPKQNFFN